MFPALSRNLTGAWYVPKSSFSRNFEESPFNGVAGLQNTFCNATKNELLTKFIKGALKFPENFQEVISNEVPYQKFTDLQTADFSLACIKTPEITPAVEFFSSEAGANGFSTE